MSTETKDKLTPEEKKKLLNLASILRSAYMADGKKAHPELLDNEQTLAGRFKNLLTEKIPGLELREEISREIEKWKKGLDSEVYSPEEVDHYVAEEIRKGGRLYIDSAKHIQMYNRKYIEDKLLMFINKVLDAKEVKVDDLYKIAFVAFDLNGLKTLNDSSGHEAGNQALKIFSKILKGGETSTWLRARGVKVIPAHQSGDEFMLLLQSENDLGAIAEEIKHRYEEEVKKFKAADLLSFETAKKYLTDIKIYDKFLEGLIEKGGNNPKEMSGDELLKRKKDLEDKFSREFVFRLGTSVGLTTLAEALSQVDQEEIKNKNYPEIAKSLVGKIIGTADLKANDHKKISKAAIAEADPFLGAVTSRGVTGLDRDNTEERANLILRNSRLEAEVAELRRKISSLEAQDSLK